MEPKSHEKGQLAPGIVDRAERPIVTGQTVEHVCPHCHSETEDGATFCGECGAALQQLAVCPNCNSPTFPHADICEVCGTWLLTGQCKFCYGYVAEDDAFCGECGNPTAGIICSRCGELSIFDFCKFCGIPLSIQAKEMVRETVQDAGFNEMANLFEQLAVSDDASRIATDIPGEDMPDSSTDTPFQDDELLRLKAYRDAVQATSLAPNQKEMSKSFFSTEQKKSIRHLNQEVAQEEERRRIEKEKRRQEEERKRREAEERRRLEEERRKAHERRLREQIKEAMQKLGGKTFSTNQQARRYFMNIIAALPEEVAEKIRNRGIKWRCNAYDCVHDSPGDCADPSRGGVWLML